MPQGNSQAKIASAVVPNPYHNPRYPNDSSNPRTITVAVRRSAVQTLSARGMLAYHQELAARRFEHIFEIAEIGSLHAADPGRLVVDGGRRGDPIGDRQIDAVRELAAIRHLLGKSCFAVVSNICGRGHDLGACGLGTDKQARLAAAAVLRFCLSDLADHWGLGS